MPSQRRLLPLVVASCLLSWGIAQTQITIRPGDTLWGLANRHGTSVDAIRGANDLTSDTLKPGMILVLPGDSSSSTTEYTVETGDTLYEIAVAYSISVDDLIAFNNLDGSVIRPGQVLSLVAPDIELPPLIVTVAPGDSLWGIARENEVTVSALAAANGISTAAVLQPGDRLTVPGRYAGSHADQGGFVAPVITVAPGESLWQLAQRYDTTVAALMAANELGDTNIRAGERLRIVPGTQLVRAVPAPATPAAEAGVLLWPVRGDLTSRFGYRQLRIGGTNMHYGIDIDGDVGDPVQAAAGGVVTFSGWQGGYGNVVIVQAGETEYYYAHLNSVAVSAGDAVQSGQIIGTVGSTGRSTGSHLHFEVRVDGTPVDPLTLLQVHADN